MNLAENLRERKEKILGRKKEEDMEWGNPDAFLNYFRNIDFKKRIGVHYENLEKNFQYNDLWDFPRAIREIKRENEERQFFYAHHESYISRNDRKYIFDLSFGELPSKRISTPANEQEIPELRIQLIYNEKILGSE
ncbi:MAG: hypothetical protein ABEI74_03955 [Candidatus Pacearchaeota archaeon]